MNKDKVDQFIMMNAENLPQESLPWVRQQLENLDESREMSVLALSMKKPTTALIIGLLGGGFGADRFYLGHAGLGVAKLLTCGGLGIWALVDLFLIMGAAREQNLINLNAIIA